MKYFVLILILSASAMGQWTMSSGSGYIPPPPPPPPGSEPWRGILDYSRAADWSHVGVKNGIPIYTFDCGTIAPGGLKAWQANKSYNVNDQISDTRGNIETVTVAGTSGATEPPAGGSGTSIPAGNWPIVPDTTLTEAGSTLTWKMSPGNTPPGTDTANVTNAVINCGDQVQTAQVNGGVVHLTAGHYYFTSGITFNTGSLYPQTIAVPQRITPVNKVLLKGQGPMQTYLHFQRVGNCSGDICVQSYATSFTTFAAGPGRPANLYPGSAALWMGASAIDVYDKGATQLIAGSWQLSTGAAPAAEPDIGDQVFLDQNNDAVSLCPATPPDPPYNCTVPGATANGSIATITTSMPHGYHVGQCVALGDVGGKDANLGTANVPAVLFNIAQNPATGQFLCGSPPDPSAPPNLSSLPNLPLWWPIAAVGCIVSGAFVDQSQCAPGAVINAFQYDAGQSNLTPARITNIQVAANVLIVTSIGHNLNVGDQASLSNLTGAASVLNGLTITVTGVTANASAIPQTFTANLSGVADIASMATGGRADAIPPKPSGGGQVTADTGGVWLSSVNGGTMILAAEATQSARLCPPNSSAPNPACGQGEYSIRSQFEAKTITAKTPGGQGTCPAMAYMCYTIDPPLYMNNWRSSQRPGMWYSGPKANFDGLEGFTLLTEHDPGYGDRGAIRFTNAWNNWVRNIRAIDINRNFIWNVMSGRITAMDNYIGGTKGGASTAYVFEDNAAADTLIMNNICQHTVSCLMTSTVMGRVAAYNFMLDPGYNNTLGQFMPLMTMNHLAAFYNLFEGNDSAGIQTDNFHGTGGVATGFRSRVRGDDLPNKAANRNGINSGSFNRALNFIGMVMGMDIQNRYIDDNPANASGGIDRIVFSLGRWKVGIGSFGTDQLATTTSMRWGNYDSVTQTVRWCEPASLGTADCSCGQSTVTQYYCRLQNEVPTQGFTFLAPNAVPANHILPPSFFLTGQPYFWRTNWGTPGWPAIGPDVDASVNPALDTTCAMATNGGQSTTGTGPGAFSRCDGIGHHAYQIPAQICYNNLPVDPQFQRTFTITNAIWASSGCTLGRACVTLTVNNDLEPTDPNPPHTKFDWTIQVTGVNPPGYNGTFQAESITPTSIKYMSLYPSPGPGPYSSGGTITTPNYKQFDAHMCYPNLPY